MKAIYCPFIPRQVIAARVEIGRMAFTELGLEKRCTTCADTFPADTEFFTPSPKYSDGLSSMCRVCQHGRKVQ